MYKLFSCLPTFHQVWLCAKSIYMKEHRQFIQQFSQVAIILNTIMDGYIGYIYHGDFIHTAAGAIAGFTIPQILGAIFGAFFINWFTYEPKP